MFASSPVLNRTKRMDNGAYKFDIWRDKDKKFVHKTFSTIT